MEMTKLIPSTGVEAGNPILSDRPTDKDDGDDDDDDDDDDDNDDDDDDDD